MVKTEVPYLEGTVGDLLAHYSQFGYAETFGAIEKSFAGEEADGEFRVPAADTGQEVFFNNRELLSRFASLTKPVQIAFLWAIRNAMRREEVNMINLKVRWSARKERTIQIRKINSSGCLNIFLLG